MHSLLLLGLNEEREKQQWKYLQKIWTAKTDNIVNETGQCVPEGGKRCAYEA